MSEIFGLGEWNSSADQTELEALQRCQIILKVFKH